LIIKGREQEGLIDNKETEFSVGRICLQISVMLLNNCAKYHACETKLQALCFVNAYCRIMD